MSGTRIWLHPFKMGIYDILRDHFAPEIVRRFQLDFEVDLFALNPTRTQGLINQKKDQNLILEVRYRNADGTTEFICDVHSWATQQQTEVKLLQFITDKFKAGKIGADWVEKDGQLAISSEVKEGVYATPDEPTVGNTNPTGRVHGRRKGNR